MIAADINFLYVSLKMGLEIVNYSTNVSYRNSSLRNLYIGVYQLSDGVIQSKHCRNNEIKENNYFLQDFPVSITAHKFFTDTYSWLHFFFSSFPLYL